MLTLLVPVLLEPRLPVPPLLHPLVLLAPLAGSLQAAKFVEEFCSEIQHHSEEEH